MLNLHAYDDYLLSRKSREAIGGLPIFIRDFRADASLFLFIFLFKRTSRTRAHFSLLATQISLPLYISQTKWCFGLKKSFLFVNFFSPPNYNYIICTDFLNIFFRLFIRWTKERFVARPSVLVRWSVGESSISICSRFTHVFTVIDANQKMDVVNIHRAALSRSPFWPVPTSDRWPKSMISTRLWGRDGTKIHIFVYLFNFQFARVLRKNEIDIKMFS